MVCPDCHGSGYFAVPDKDDDGFHYVYHHRPCFECQGSGIVSCCDTTGASFPIIERRLHNDDEKGVITGADEHIDLPQYFSGETAGGAGQVSAEDNWQDWVNSQLAGTTRKDETALYARIVELEKRVGELERK